MDAFLRDLRFAIRGLRRSPGFAATAILMLALGIGAVTTIFAQVNAVFLKTLPVGEPENLRRLSWTSNARAFAGSQFARYGDAIMARGGTLEGFPHSVYLLMEDPPEGFSNIACTSGANLRVLGDAGLVNGLLVTGNYFTTMRATVALGRPILPADDRPGAEPVAVISYGFWQRGYGGDPDVVNRFTMLRGVKFRIVGVMPEGFTGIDPSVPNDVMLPFAARALTTQGAFDPDRWGSCSLVGRLVSAGSSDERARLAAEAVVHRFIQANPPRDAYELPRVWMTDVSRGTDSLRTMTSQPLVILSALVVATLLIACANVAGLLTARSEARRREMATRCAIGASHSRIVRQLLTESVVLCVAGAALGTALVYALSPLLPDLLREIAEIPGGGAPSRNAAPGVETALDWRVLAFVIGIMAITALVFGMAPALRSARRGLTDAMKPGSPTTSVGRGRLPVGSLVVGAQVVLSMLLLVTAGLFVRTVLNLWAVPIGYNPERLLYVTTDEIRTRPLVDEVQRRLSGMPGVASAAVSQWPLFTNAERETRVCLQGAREELVDSDRVTARYFETWGTPFVAGRDFGETAEQSVIVNQTFARRFLPGNPIGQVVALLGCPGRPMTVVGVVADHTDRPRVEVTPMVYLSYRLVGPTVPMTFTLRTSGDSAAMVAPLRRVMSEFPTAVGGDVTTGIEYRDRTLTQVRALSGLVTFFSGLAVLLSCLGLYGMLSYRVARRTPEIGVRMAFGARTLHVIRAVGAESLIVVAIGILVGSLAAVAAARAIATILFGVSPGDPWILGGSATLLLAFTLIAMAWPVARACRISPLEALRDE